jgi:hypothetical protein
MSSPFSLAAFLDSVPLYYYEEKIKCTLLFKACQLLYMRKVSAVFNYRKIIGFIGI